MLPRRVIARPSPEREVQSASGLRTHEGRGQRRVNRLYGGRRGSRQPAARIPDNDQLWRQCDTRYGGGRYHQVTGLRLLARSWRRYCDKDGERTTVDGDSEQENPESSTGRTPASATLAPSTNFSLRIRAPRGRRVAYLYIPAVLLVAVAVILLEFVSRSGSRAQSGRDAVAPATATCVGKSLIASLTPRNPGSDISDRLIPKSQPSGGTICEYSPPIYASQVNLSRSAHLSPSQAKSLAMIISAIKLTSSSGEGCPIVIPGAVTIIEMTYSRHATVTLAYFRSGCQSLSNGKVTAFEVANPSFYNGLVPRVNQLIGA